MDISSLIAMSLRQPTAEKAAMYIISELFKCTDVDLISLLIEDAAEDQKAVIDGLKAELVGKKPQFDSKMIGIFRQLLNAKTNADMIEAMKKRPAVASALDYVVKLYAEYASSREVLDSIAFSPVDGADFFDVKVPELPSKPGKVPPDFAKKLDQAVRTDIEKIALNHLQRPEVQNLYRTSGQWQRAADDGEVAADAEVVTAQDVKKVEDDVPVQSLDDSKKIVKSYKNAIDKGTATVANAFADNRFQAAITALRDSYVDLLGRFFAQEQSVDERILTKNISIFHDGGNSYRLRDLLQEFDPRTYSDFSYWNKRIAVEPLGPYFSLKDYLLPMAVKNGVLGLDKTKSKIARGNPQNAIIIFVKALERLAIQMKSDLDAVKPETMNVRPRAEPR